MQFQVSRDGQLYGPYTLEDLQRYIDSGNLLRSDLAKSDDMPDWLPVSKILHLSSPHIVLPPVTTYPPESATLFTATGIAYPDPPNLPWGLLLLLDLLTCGLFQIAWNIIIAVWARRIDPASNALNYYVAAVVLSLASFGSSFGNLLAQMHHEPMHTNYIGLLLGISLWLVRLIARFSLRETLERHYNVSEPLRVDFNGVLTFFFGGLYFMYKLNRVNEIKQAFRYQNLSR